jgi:hypothetical protein
MDDTREIPSAQFGVKKVSPSLLREAFFMITNQKIAALGSSYIVMHLWELPKAAIF